MSKFKEEEITEEIIIKAVKSAEYFITHFCMIETTTKGFIDFDLYDYQKEALQSYGDERFCFVLKSRQLVLQL